MTLSVEEQPRYINSNSGNAEVSDQSLVIDGEWVWEDGETLQRGEGRFAATCV